VGAGVVRPPVRLGADAAGEVGDRPAQELTADVETEDIAGLRPDLVEQGRRAADPCPVAGDTNEAVGFEIGKGEADGRLRQSGAARQLCPRHGPFVSDPLQQELFVHRPDQLWAGGDARAVLPAGGGGRHLDDAARICRRRNDRLVSY
jgi:hypothetical protein